MADMDGYVKIGTKIDDKDIKPQTDRLSNTLKTSFAKAGLAVTAVTLAIKGAVKVMGDLNAAYMVQAKAEKTLEQAAKNNPYLNSESVKSMKAFASELQKVTNYGDEMTIGLMAQLAAAGRTQGEIQSIMNAAANLAASGVMSYDAAVKNLSKTYGGMTGELGESIPALKTLTAEQLKAGAGVELVAKQYDGFAAAAVDKTKQIQNATGDLKEAIGEIGASTGLTDVFQNSLLAMVEWYASGIKMFNDWIKRLRGISTLSLEEQRNNIKGVIDEQKYIIKEFQKELSKPQDPTTYDYLNNGLNSAIDKLAQYQDALVLINADIEKEGKLTALSGEAITTNTEKINARVKAEETYNKTVSDAQEKARGGLITQEELWKITTSAADTYADSLIAIGYKFDDLSTIGGKALDEIRIKLTGIDLGKGLNLSFGGIIGGNEMFDLFKTATAEIKTSGQMFLDAIKETAEKGVNEFNNTMQYKEASITDSIKSFMGEASAAFSSGFAVATTVVKGAISVINNILKFNPATFKKSLEDFLLSVTTFFDKTLPSLPIYAEAAVSMLKTFGDTLIENLPVYLETLGNIITIIFDAIGENAGSASETLLTVISGIIVTVFQKLPAIIKGATEAISGIYEALVHVVPPMLQGMLEALGEGLPEIIASLIDLIFDVAIMAPQFAVGFISAIVGAMPEIVTGLIEALPMLMVALNVLPALISASLIAMLPELLAAVVLFPVEMLALWLEKIIEFAEDPEAAIDAFIEMGKNLIEGLREGLENSFTRIKTKIENLWDSLVSSFKKLFKISSPSKLFEDFGANIIDGLWNGLKNTMDSVSESIKTMFKNAFEFTIDLSGKAKDIIKSFGDNFTKAAATTWDGVKSFFRGAFDFSVDLSAKAKSIIKTFNDNFTDKTKTAWTSVKSFFTSITGGLDTLKTDVKNYGKNTIQGFIDGAKENANALKLAVVKIFTDALAKIKEILGIASPSKVFKEIGKFVDEGFIEGVKEKELKVKTSLTDTMTGGIQNVINSLDGMRMRNIGRGNTPIVIKNYNEAVLKLNEKIIGRVAFQGIDKNIRTAYGT